MTDETKIALDHWLWVEGLIERTITGNMTQDEVTELCQYLYRTAFVHGWKHAIEDLEQQVPEYPGITTAEVL